MLKTALNLTQVTSSTKSCIIQGPGPADYSPFPADQDQQSNKPTELPYYRQKHYLCISAPAMPLPPLPPAPGPGHYETQDQMTTATNG